MLTDGVFYLQTVAGDELRGIAASAPPSDARIARRSVQVNHAIERLRKYLSPPVIQLETTVIQEKTDRPRGFATLMFPGMLYSSVFFIAGGLATDV